MTDSAVQPYTVTLDYYATGEGRHILALVCPSVTPEQARFRFADKFGDQFAEAATVTEGIVRNDVTKILFAEEAFKYANNLIREFGPGACPVVTGSFEFNLA